ncbi:ribokinase [Thermotoga sp. Mc24]|uniref:ribokinase n=1 Tax=Thermotoga sp. Mc24 TaxID=1231241 RepID=UPI00054397CF|nr:ribokinase [Thermotoga sp. Mc24]KHC90881.1 ribokinase [Thermotoga sp. Mc24]
MISVVGSSNIDIVLKVDHFTKPGETQKALEMNVFPGGKGANQAVTVAKIGRKGCHFVTCVGNDGYSDLIIKNFEKLGITGYIRVDTPTGRAFIEVDKTGQNRIIIFPGANAELKRELIDWKTLSESDILLLQNEIPFETTLECAKKFGGIVIFDPAPAQGINGEIFQYVDYLTPNEKEIEALSKEFFGEFLSIEKAAENFLKLGVRNVIVKLGDKGALLVNKNGEKHFPAFKVKAVDTTAAGDVFNGAFAVVLSEGKPPEEAVIFGMAAAAISVTKVGAQSSIPAREEVEAFLKNL